jgi:hypothetical protein
MDRLAQQVVGHHAGCGRRVKRQSYLTWYINTVDYSSAEKYRSNYQRQKEYAGISQRLPVHHHLPSALLQDDCSAGTRVHQLKRTFRSAREQYAPFRGALANIIGSY